MRTTWASSVSAPTRVARITMVPVPFTVPPVTGTPATFSTGMGSPVTIDSSTLVAAIEDDAVDRDALTGPHAHPIADTNIAKRHIALGFVRIDAMRRLRRKPEQGPDRGAGAAPRAQLQHLAEQHKHNDDGSRLEIHGNVPAHAEGVRKEIRCDRRDDAEAVRRADAERDQRKHVEVPARDGGPASREERPSSPQNDRRRQNQLYPGQGAGVDPRMDRLSRKKLVDHHQQDWKSERERPAYASRHVVELFVRLLVERDVHGLERHAADRARARTKLSNLGVHRAGVFRLGIRGRGYLAAGDTRADELVWDSL